MKNLFTLLLLVVSFLAVGQTNNTTEEIKYWKSIADSNDTVAYRQYLNRYGENGLYKDEAITRIALLKTSGKQTHSNSIECCFYNIPSAPLVLIPKEYHSVVRFDSDLNKVWIKHTNYDCIRSNLAISRDFYESQAVLALLRGTREYENAIRNDNKAMEDAEYAKKYEKNHRKKLEILQKAEQAKSSEYYKNAWTADEEYEYVPMKSTSARDVYFKRDNLYEFDRVFWGYSFKGHSESDPAQHFIFYVYSDDYYNDKYYIENRDHHDEMDIRDEMMHLVGRYKITKTMQGYRYIAISKDKSSIIMWFEDDDNLDGKIYEKREYKRINKEELLPKKANYDFLNE